MRARVLVLVALTLAMVAALGGVAWAAVISDAPVYTTPADCYTCHGTMGTGAVSKVEFSVPAVNYNKCATCHAAINAAQHWHNASPTFSTCAGCHRTVVPIITDTARRFTSTFISPVYGTFKSAASLSASPQSLHATHSGTGWVNSLVLRAGSTASCANCHRPVACSACHGDVQHTDHAVSQYPGVTYRQATGTGTTTSPSTCVNSACHDLTKAATTEFVPSCGSCHPSAEYYHGYFSADHVANDDVVESIACSSCHSLDLATAHGDPIAIGTSCATCHPTPRNTYGAWDQSCATGGCHTPGSTAPMHANTATAHQVDAGNQLCLDCHAGTELGSIHAEAKSKIDPTVTSCLVCHAASSVPSTRDCTSCHFIFEDHYDETAHSSYSITCGGTGCHATPDLMGVHTQRSTTFTCLSCHSSVRQAVQDAITAGDTSCGACHGSISGLGGHRDAHNASPPLRDGTTKAPYYSYYTGSAGSMHTGDCAGCHTSNLVDEHAGLRTGTAWVIFPRRDASGAALTCATCHDQLAGSAVQNAIEAGLSACESCHDVHGPMPRVHTSTFVDVQDVPCVDCHSATLTVEHNGTYTSAAGLTGCDVCHDLFTGMTSGPVTGAATQAAISPGNDTRCSACHTTYHADLTGAHTASSAGSRECAVCHAAGGTTSIDVTAVGLHKTCATCHKSTRLGTVSGRTAECASCHSAEGTDYHRDMSASHTFGGMDTSCQTCHAKTLPEAHAPYLSRYTAYATTCALCHRNADPNRVPATATADCSTCHVVHGDVDTLHTSTSSQGCVRCHDSADVRLEHATIAGGPSTSCNVCHDAPGSTDGKTAECTTCHYDGGVPFHTEMALRHVGISNPATCVSVGCHPSTDVTAVHERYVGAGKQFPQYEDTCALCHLNADPDRIDWALTIDGTCMTCHGWPHDRQDHTARSDKSQTCAGCHSLWVPETHNADTMSGDPTENCNTCHNNPEKGDLAWNKTTSDCEGCHAKYPVATNHYPTALHLSTDTGCAGCHFPDLKTEHDKTSIAVTCVECHTDPQDAAVIAAGWNKSCDACHPGKHAEQSARHVSARTDCSTSGCHGSDVSVIHAKKANGGCSICHTGPAQLDTQLKKNCTDSGCHPTYHARTATAHKAIASAACTRCHSAVKPDGSQLEPLHKDKCATCHANPSRVPDITKKTAECASCHATSGTDYHRTMNTKHTYSAMEAGCQGSDCHARTLPEEHAKYLSRYTGYADTCALCHLNAVPSRIPANATAACASCHTVHGPIGTIHTAKNSQSCAACHETQDALALHRKTDGTPDCAKCHRAPTGRIDWSTATIECVSCHSNRTPIDPNHYPLANHDATAETTCGQCHYRDMKAEHSKPTVSPVVTCVSCHETKVDSFTASWNQTCAACHPTKHAAQATKHVSTTASCGGTGCHDIGNVEVIHGKPTGPGCAACHKSPAAPATTTTCTASGCHAGIGTDHKGLHESAAVNGTGCAGCHFTNLVDEHQVLGFTCDTCHKSTVPAVKAAITANDLRCKSCHPAMHPRLDWEFNPARSSLHRVRTDLPGMRSSFVVNGVTYTWTLPAASTFLKAGWTTSSIMACTDCHSYSGATGPHGATMKVNIDPAYPNPFRVGSTGGVAQLSPNSSTGMSMTTNGSTNARIICEKCHDLYNGSSWSTVVHKEHDDRGREGGYCNYCHTAVPHGWSRPRMLAYTTDPAPYAVAAGGVQRITIKSYTPNSWNDNDCGAACDTSHHPLSGIGWPADSSAPVTTGNVSGTVSSSAGGTISGATVSIAGKTATTSSTGTYTITGITGGTYTMTVSATGHNTWSGSVTITNGATATQNVTLTRTATTGNVTGTVSSSGGGTISGATVSIAGKTATTSSTGTYSITGITGGTYTMTVSATGHNTWSGSVTITNGATATQNVTLTRTPVSTNLARTGTATASSTSGSNSPSNAIDGSTSTFWSSTSGGTQWLRVDLGSSKTLTSVVVNWNGWNYAKAYRVETSPDGTTWTSRFSTTNGSSGTQTITLSAVSARHVRVSCTSANSSTYRVNELEAWGY